MRTSFATISRQGARSNNEDYLLVMDRPEAKRLTGIVCDGMGGHSCGEVASLTVCNCIAHYWEQHTALPDSPEKVLEACREASAAMDRKAAEKGVPCEVVAEHADAIWKGVLACAVRHDVSFIVMASRGLGSIGSFLLGSETQKVLHQVDRPVLIVR